MTGKRGIKHEASARTSAGLEACRAEAKTDFQSRFRGQNRFFDKLKPLPAQGLLTYQYSAGTSSVSSMSG